MTAFRWAIGVFAALLATGAVFSFVLFIAFDAQVWRERAARLGAWLRLVALLWFNIEVWGRVVWTLVRWNR
jgi:hypothetical protein